MLPLSCDCLPEFCYVLVPADRCSVWGGKEEVGLVLCEKPQNTCWSRTREFQVLQITVITSASDEIGDALSSLLFLLPIDCVIWNE
jgi:hypothetical protein